MKNETKWEKMAILVANHVYGGKAWRRKVLLGIKLPGGPGLPIDGLGEFCHSDASCLGIHKNREY